MQFVKAEQMYTKHIKNLL